MARGGRVDRGRSYSLHRRQKEAGMLPYSPAAMIRRPLCLELRPTVTTTRIINI